ncbi:unnamed protein product, partial [Meganyctiphanes norvegica]
MSVVKVKEEIKDIEEPIIIQSIEIKLKEEIEIYAESIAFTEEHYPKHEKLDLIEHQKQNFLEKPYKCMQINKALSHTNDILIHQRSQTGEKPYQCSKCDKSFTQNGTLKTHQRTHTG